MQASRAGRRTRPSSRTRPVAVVAGVALMVLALLAGYGPVAGVAGGAPATRAGGHDRGAARLSRRVVPPAPPGPASAYDCTFNLTTDAFTGADGTASQIGWEGNHQGVVTCLGGTFFVQDGINANYGFGVYSGGRTTWQDADGYLPAQITSFRHAGSLVSITEFADRVVIAGDAYVAVYARVAVSNPTGRTVEVDPDPSPGLVPLAVAPDAVTPHSTADHDYVVAADRFGNDYPWPTTQALADAGSFDDHFAHMQDFWNQQLSGIAEVHVPDPSLDDAYRSGFIYTQIARSGDDLNSGVNGYESEFSHDVVGILTNLFTQGYFTDAHALLLEARDVVGSQGQYVDGVWTYAVPWAVYLVKTGDVAFVKENFSTGGPAGADQPSIEETAHELVADRTGLGGIMEATDDIDTQGYWTTDDYEALLGLAAYRYLAAAVGDTAEATWATQEYRQLLAATNAVLDSTISRYDLDYLPCSIVQPNTANRCSVPEDANWTSPFGFGSWAWEGYLFGAPRSGPGLSLIDATYDYGFGRLTGLLPPNDAGGFPGDYYSSGYNAAVGAAGLASTHHRDQGILDYQFMVENSQSGPYSWWESSSAPSSSTPWVGRHPAAGQGASPHAWGMAGANKVLLDSLVAQRSDGALIVGRGVPGSWLGLSTSIAVTDFPTTDGRRVSLTISSRGRSVSLLVRGQPTTGPVLFEVPSFVHNLATASAGRIDQATGTVTLSPGTMSVTVELRHGPGSPPSGRA